MIQRFSSIFLFLYLFFLFFSPLQANIPDIHSEISKRKIIISITPEDEIKALLIDGKKYHRNKWGCTSLCACCIAATAVSLKYCSTEITAVCLIGVLGSCGSICWNWWSENRSYRQAQTIATKNGFEFALNDSKKLDDMSTQTDD